jgi:hypothetical protein
VAVPVVLHGFRNPPASTRRSITAGAAALPPLWPGSRTTTVRVAGDGAGACVVVGAGGRVVVRAGGRVVVGTGAGAGDE